LLVWAAAKNVVKVVSVSSKKNQQKDWISLLTNLKIEMLNILVDYSRIKSKFCFRIRKIKGVNGLIVVVE